MAVHHIGCGHHIPIEDGVVDLAMVGEIDRIVVRRILDLRTARQQVGDEHIVQRQDHRVADDGDDFAMERGVGLGEFGRADGALVALERVMQAGDLDVTVFQDAAGQGGGALDAALKLAKGETVEQKVMVPFQLVTPENMADFAKSN